MPGLVDGKSLGLIETVGLVGAIEACDAAAKAANVVVSAAEVTDAALVTLKIYGELAAVQAAVEAGAKAAMRVGELLATHVIPNPDGELNVIMGGVFEERKPRPPGTQKPSGKTPVPEKPIPSRAKSSSGSDTSSTKIEDMRVTQLRAYARGISNLGIKGREISRADRDTLLREIKKALESQ